jgi:hypothetical protein
MRLVVQEVQHMSSSAANKHLTTVEHRLERYISWDLVMVVENWLADEVPPYRWVRRFFSLACSYFSVQKVFAFLLSAAIIGLFIMGVSKGMKWGCGHISSLTHPAGTLPHRRGTGALIEFAEAPVSLKGEGKALPSPDSGEGGRRPDEGAAPVPQIIEHTYGVGHKLRLRWNSMGQGMGYLIYRSFGNSQDPARPLNDGKPIRALGALIDIAPFGDKDTWLSVTAVGDGQESKPSDPVQFEFTAMNRYDTVEPLAEEQTTTTSMPHPTSGHPLPRGEGSAKHGVRQSTTNQQIASTNQLVPVQTSAPSAKPSYISAFTQQLLKNTAPSAYGLLNSRGSPDNRKLRQEDGTDGTIASVVPYHTVSQGLIATKNAAIAVGDEGIPHPTPLPSRERASVATGEGGSVPAPTGLKAQVTGPLQIRFTWKEVPGCAGYNFYSAKKGDPTPTKETPEPLLSPWGNWTSDTGPGEFRFAVRALDAQGRESANFNILQMEVQ